MIVGTYDFETTSTAPANTTVIQTAFVGASVDEQGCREVTARTTLCHARDIPIGATAVHGIRAADLVDVPLFDAQVGTFVALLSRCDVILTFNGAGFDWPILERYAGKAGLAEKIASLRPRHVDLYRAWKRLQGTDERAACFAGSLAGAHLYLTGETFGGAHDALNDCRATQRVFLALRERGVEIGAMQRWSWLPLPGYADFDGKLKWIGDQLVLTIGEHAGTDIAQVDTSFLRWMLGKDFARDTKDIIARVCAGEYPVRDYENETP